MNETRVPTEQPADDRTQPAVDRPVNTSNSDHKTLHKKKRRSHLLLVLLALLVVAALGGAATLLVYKYYFPNQEKQPQVSTSQTQDKKQSAALVISKIKNTYNSSPNSEAVMAVPIKVAGNDFYTGVDPSETVGIRGSVPYSESAVVSAKIAKVLKEDGFRERIIQNGNDEEMYIANYTQRDVVCSTYITKTFNNPTGDHQVEVSCANMSDYIAVASAQKPFSAAYPNKNPSDDSGVQFVGTPNVIKSKTDGYQTARLTMTGVTKDGDTITTGFFGLFYQTPDKQWHYFTNTQGTPACSNVTTEDLKKAYLDTRCLDSNGIVSSVKM